MNTIVYVIIGFSAGIAVASGIFAFVTMIGALSRIIIKTKTKKHVFLFENIALLGAEIGNYLIIYSPDITNLKVLRAPIAFGMGIYMGCVAISLEEVLNVFPIIIKRASLKTGLPILVLLFAFGKIVGSILQLLIF